MKRLPENKTDPPAWLRRAEALLFRLARLLSFPRWGRGGGMAARNRRRNAALEAKAGEVGSIPAPICGQAAGMAAAFRFGLATYAQAGCTVIAVYNALLLTGRWTALSQVGYTCETGGVQMLLGLWGIDPYSIGGVLERYGIPYTAAYSAADLEAAAQSRGRAVLILSFWNRRGRLFAGAHTVAARYDGAAGLPWTVYNRFDDDPVPHSFRTLGEVLQNGPRQGRLIVGFLSPT